ncbi:restriction endonuclease subunit S [Ruthenibacterium lactatiformans]|nr:restriction endonuclease subunit S [Ruthenibacterium lactatiformans]MBN3026788.1 restriction endonuclease subunit S [Ruthenibacterium lactatiformans]
MKFNTVKLGEYLYIKGRIGWKGLKKKEYLDKSDFRIINGESLTENGIDWNKAGYISKERYDESPEIMLQPDDILISKDGTIGKIGYIDSLNTPTTVASGIFVIRNQKPEIINTRFIYHFFCSKYFKNFITMRTEGSVIPHLYQKDFVDLDFPLPELSVQDKIVGILDAICNKIDLNKSINENLLQQAIALFDNALQQSESISFVELGSLADVKGGKRLPKGVNLITKPNSHPYIRVRDLNNVIFASLSSDYAYVDDETQKSIARYITSAGDVLVSIVGTIGLTAIVDDTLANANLTENCVKLTNLKGIIPEYLLLFLRSKEGIEAINKGTVGAVQLKLPIKNIQSIPVPLLLPIEMQALDDILSVIFNRISTNVIEVKMLSELRDTLLPKLISGELSVSKINY